MKRSMMSALGVLLAGGVWSHALAQAAPAGIRGDLIAQLDAAGNKLAQLAQAIPQNKYAWRPAAGVRSIREVLMHVATSNYFFAGMVGPQAAYPDSTINDPAQVSDQIKRSFAHLRTLVTGMSDADLDKSTTMFGRPATYRSVLLLVVAHTHEHLGQAIAYARANGVTPPWSGGGD